MATLFYRFHRLTILAIVLLVAAGLGAFFSLGRQEDPTLVERYGIITTPYPGASAERVEALISEPLEDAINELAEPFKTDLNLRQDEHINALVPLIKG